MSLKGIQAAQDEFDRRYFPRFSTLNRASDENLEPLLFLGVGISGEIGELNNIVKKVYRGDLTLERARARLTEELTDAFTYLIKLFNQLEVDMEESYSVHLTENRKRFADRGGSSSCGRSAGPSFNLTTLSAAKSWSAQKIEEQVRALAGAHAPDTRLEMELRSALRRVGVFGEKSALRFFMSAYLACILDTASELQSFELRDQQIDTVDEAITQLGLNHEHIRVLLRGVSLIRRHLVNGMESEPQS